MLDNTITTTYSPTASPKIQFLDACLPSLPDGEYTISVQTSLTSEGKEITKNDVPPVNQNFFVQGPRFSLPPDSVHACYPPPNSTGTFENDLPHVILTKKTLPWERSLQNDKSNTNSQNSGPIPWLALVLLQANELETPLSFSKIKTPSSTLAFNSTVDEFFQKAPTASSAEPSILKPSLKFTTEEKTLPIQIIQINSATFKNIIPYLDELPYLAHARQGQISMEPSDKDNQNDIFPVIMSNRFPQQKSNVSKTALNSDPMTTHYVAHLVSLEGLEPYLKPDANLAGFKSVQLISLASWSFHSNPDQTEDFSTVMTHLMKNTGLLQIPVEPKADSSKEEQEINHQFNLGYVPLAYQTQQAEITPAWYRGPFVPCPVALVSNSVPFYTNISQSTALRNYDEAYGMLDLSYVTAWELGRLLALGDSGFMQSVQGFRRERHAEFNNHLQESNLQSALSTIASPSNNNSQNEAATDFVAQLVSTLPDYVIEPMDNVLNPSVNAPVTSVSSPVNAPAHLVGSLPVTAQPITAVSAPLLLEDIKNFFNDLGKTVKNALEIVKNVLENLSKAFDDFLKKVENRPLSNELKDGLASFYTLEKVPFDYLVPDLQLLPTESLKFFYIDRNWLDALGAGALSVGVHAENDINFNKILLNSFYSLLYTSKSESSKLPVAGFLLRSEALVRWPRLVIQLFDKDLKPIQPVRQSKLASDILLCLTSSIPYKLKISEPSEQLRLGTGDGHILELRPIDTQNQLLNKTLPLKDDPKTVEKDESNTFFRQPKELNVLKIRETAQEIEKKFNPPLTLTPSKWALMFLAAPLEADFEHPSLQNFSSLKK